MKQLMRHISDVEGAGEARSKLIAYCEDFWGWTHPEYTLGVNYDDIGSEVGEKIEKVLKDTLDWVDKNALATKEEFEARQKELEASVKHWTST